MKDCDHELIDETCPYCTTIDPGPKFTETECEICNKKFLTEIWCGVKRDNICDECFFEKGKINVYS